MPTIYSEGYSAIWEVWDKCRSYHLGWVREPAGAILLCQHHAVRYGSGDLALRHDAGRKFLGSRQLISRGGGFLLTLERWHDLCGHPFQLLQQ